VARIGLVVGKQKAPHRYLHANSCSWLNAVESFFAWLFGGRLKRGVFRSVVDLQAAINRFLAETNAIQSQTPTKSSPHRRGTQC